MADGSAGKREFGGVGDAARELAARADSDTRSAPDEVWARVKADYLAGLSAPACCRRPGVGLSTLRSRAAREGWRRSDQPWTPPNDLDPWDEGVELEERLGGDLDRVELHELAWVAYRRRMRAVLRGHAAEALRWNRVCDMLEVERQELERFTEQEQAWAAQLEDAAAAAAQREDREGQDGRDGRDGVFGPPPRLDEPAPPPSDPRP
jgi:hypothetical protein